MHLKKRAFPALVALLLIGALALPAFAAEKTQAGNSPWTIYVNNQVRWGSNDRTIFSLDLLVPLYQGEKNILFFAPRLSKDDLDGSEINLGFGYRHLLFSDKAVLGVNGYYDARWTGWGSRHEQVGIGAEVMTNWVTGRMNGYFAVTDPQITGMTGAADEYYFRDIGIYTGSGSLEETLGGFDGEVGFKIPGLSKYIETWVYAGGYHFEGEYVKPVNGFSSRVEVIPTDFLRLNFEYRNDTLYHDQYYGEVAVAVPFSIENLLAGKNPFKGIGSHIGGERTLKERMVEPVRRDIDVQVYVVGSGPGAPGTETLIEDIVFVSETGSDTPGIGDGTFEMPYKSIDWAVDDPRIAAGCSIIHVINDEANPGSSAEGGVIDIAGLTIWGSGVDDPLYPVISNKTNGYPDVVAYNGNNFVLSVDAADTTITGLGFTTPSAIGSDVYGILVNNGQGLDINHNNIGSGIADGYGIYSNLSGSNIGALGTPALFAYNNIELVGGLSATGIYLGADNIYADFTANTITGSSGITEGITLVSTGDIGASGAPVNFTDNIINLDCAEIRGITYTAGLEDYDVSYIDFAGIVGGDYSSLPAVTGSGSAYVEIAGNVISESGGVASLGITGIAAGDHVADLIDNTIVIAGADIASGILLGAGNGLDALITTDTGAPVSVSGGTAALGITGVGLGLSGGLTHLHIDYNTLTVLSGVAASGILAGSGAGLDASITFNNVTGTGGYAAVGITALGANYLGAGGTTLLDISDNTLALTSPGGGVSGILFGSGGNITANISRNAITGDGYYAALGITAATCIMGGVADLGVYNNSIGLTSTEGGISGILLASLGGLNSEVGNEDLGNSITGTGKYAALGITQFGLDWLDTGVLYNSMHISSDYFASGILLASAGDLWADVDYNNLGPASITGGALALGITAINYGGEFGVGIDNNVLNVSASGAELPVYEVASFLNSYMGGIINPAAFDSSPYDVGIASGIMALSISGTDYYTEIFDNTVAVDGLSLAAGITTAGLFVDLGDSGDGISIYGNTLTVDSDGGGDLTELVSDLAAGFIGSPLPWNGYLEGFDGGASGIAMLTTNDLYADVNNNALDVHGGLGALGITAFGDDIDLNLNDNNLLIASGGVSSGILMLAMNELHAGIYGTNRYLPDEGDPGYDPLDPDKWDNAGISGAYAALGITGIALGSGGNSYVDISITDLTNFDCNYLTLNSGGVASGILLASLGNLESHVEFTTIDATGTYAALGITEFAMGNLITSTFRDYIGADSDYFASGILAVAVGGMTGEVQSNTLGFTSETGIYGDAFALGITLIGVNGNVDIYNFDNSLDVAAIGTGLDVSGAASFLDTVPYVGDFINPAMFETDPYHVGVASGIMELSVFGDTLNDIIGNDVQVQGQSLAAGITVASIFGDIGTSGNPFVIGSEYDECDNTIDVTATGGGDLFELVSDLIVGYGGVTVPWSDGDLLGYDGAAFGITMLTTNNLYADVEENTLDVSGGLGALGITAFGNDIGSATDPLILNNNSLEMASDYVSSGILLFAMNRLNANITYTNANNTTNSISGGYAALGITGIALNLNDDGNNVYAADNYINLYSEGGTSGILLASLNNLNFDIEHNTIYSEAEYAALGITAISGDDIGYGTPAVVSNNKISLDTDYVSSGILLLAADDLTASVEYNDLSDPIRGDLAALGISLLSYGGDINANINYNDLRVLAVGRKFPVGDTIDFLNSTFSFGIPNPGLGDYRLGIASGILVASYEGDIYGTVSNNGNTGETDSIFRVRGNTAASGIIMASYGGSLYSTISDNTLSVISDGTGVPGVTYGIDDLLFDAGLDLSYMPFETISGTVSFDGTASGITLLTGSDGMGTSGIFTPITGNVIQATGKSLAAGVFMYAWDGDIGAEGAPLLINDNRMTVTSGIFGSGIVALAGWDPDDGSGATGDVDSIYATITQNRFNVTADYAMAAYLDASGWIGSTGTRLHFHNNRGTIEGTTVQAMLALVGDSGVPGNANYVRWANNANLTTVLGPWTGFYPALGGPLYLDPSDTWNVNP